MDRANAQSKSEETIKLGVGFVKVPNECTNRQEFTSEILGLRPNSDSHNIYGSLQLSDFDT